MFSFQNVFFLSFLTNIKFSPTKTSWFDEWSVPTRR